MNTTVKNKLKETLEFIEGAYAPATIRAYKGNFDAFIRFCDMHHENALPASPENISNYIKKLTGRKLKSSSIRIAIASLSAIHRLNRMDDPTQDPIVKIEMRRMHRNLGRESKQAFGINKEMLMEMLNTLDSSLKGLRDSAIILLAYEGMCRRSEIVSIKIEDIEIKHIDNGLVDLKIKLRKSKTDQEGIGKWLHIQNESKKAIIKWIEASEVKSGYLFRAINKSGVLSERLCASQINRIFKRVAINTKISEEIVKSISGHSMRVGAAQDLILLGASLPVIMTKGRWSKSETVIRYIERTQI